ncbi:MAG: hypothetical protein JSV27_08480 [Candidatus Bathyarchaeota archaeon]|nr:MAG: hypothetical protein JSV27_08480 [Candidatus Bathyarchaeota archaeon]
MNRKYALSGILLIAISVLALGYLALNRGRPQEVTFDQLSANPDRYRGKSLVIEGFYFHGWETIVLCEGLEPSGLAEGHLVPKGETIWVEGGIPRDVFEALHRQEMMGPEERFGKIRVKGRYEHGGEYGHLGGFSSQIVPSEVEMLQWSP